MNQTYWVSVWAKRRQDEVIRFPTDYKVHEDFLLHMDIAEVKSAFTEINTLFLKIYDDISQQPEAFGMPLNLKEVYRIFSKEWRDSGQAPYRLFVLLYNLFICGEIMDAGLIVSIEKYKALKPPPKHQSGIDQKVKYPQFLFDKLNDYGFIIEGLKNNKLTTSDILITYPDNPTVLRLFKQLADKARNTNRLEDFLCCHYRLLQDDMETVNYGQGIDDVADSVHTDAEKEFCYKIDEALMSKGLVRKSSGGIECHGIAYYQNNITKTYSFRLVTRGMDFEHLENEIKKMRLLLRIRNVPNCLDYIESCPDSIKQIFTEYNDAGCEKRYNGTCKHGISYEIDAMQYWRCACCHSPFNFKPDLLNIPHYIKLVELGEKK